jgi:hypothetical protein
MSDTIAVGIGHIIYISGYKSDFIVEFDTKSLIHKIIIEKMSPRPGITMMIPINNERMYLVCDDCVYPINLTSTDSVERASLSITSRIAKPKLSVHVRGEIVRVGKSYFYGVNGHL